MMGNMITPGHPLPPVVPLLIGYNSLALVNGSLAGKPEMENVFSWSPKGRKRLRTEPSDVPEFYALIFAVADDMSRGD